jgi:hypothetical protein
MRLDGRQSNSDNVNVTAIPSAIETSSRGRACMMRRT